jgi:hypothetical protein
MRHQSSLDFLSGISCGHSLKVYLFTFLFCDSTRRKVSPRCLETDGANNFAAYLAADVGVRVALGRRMKCRGRVDGYGGVLMRFALKYVKPM